MQILKGSRREITIMEWNELLSKAKRRLAESEKCYELYHDDDSLEWIQQDKKKVAYIEKQIEEVIKIMDKNDIK